MMNTDFPSLAAPDSQLAEINQAIYISKMIEQGAFVNNYPEEFSLLCTSAVQGAQGEEDFLYQLVQANQWQVPLFSGPTAFRPSRQRQSYCSLWKIFASQYQCCHQYCQPRRAACQGLSLSSWMDGRTQV